tara:strand:- start:1567 stop:1812 length:246 start_codon:yes stop_codon:yes gene_type:complete
MEEDEPISNTAMSDACEFALLSIRNMILPSIDGIKSKEDLEIFMGTLSGIMAGWGMTIQQSDPKLYNKLLESLEVMALKHG